MKDKKTKVKYVDIKDIKQKKGWGLGVGRKSKTKKLSEIMTDGLSKKMRLK